MRSDVSKLSDRALGVIEDVLIESLGQLESRPKAWMLLVLFSGPYINEAEYRTEGTYDGWLGESGVENYLPNEPRRCL